MKKLVYLSFLLSGLSVPSLALAQDTFDGSNIKATFELWKGGSPVAGGSVNRVDDEAVAVVGDAATPDFKDFNDSYDDYELWDFDFSGRQITLTYTSIYKQDFDHQYMYTSSKGFHFEDVDNQLNDIVGVSLDASSEVFGFDPAKITFDADNIYIDLEGSMCHIAGMASMPDCANPGGRTGTGYDNQLKLMVAFAGGGASPAPGPAPMIGFANQVAIGLWWNPEKAGQGYSVHQIGNQMAMVWYTYKEDNTPTWYLASGPKNGDGWQAELKQYQWDGAQAVPTTVGTVSIQFMSAESGTLDWQLGGQSGKESISLFPIPGAADANRTGLLYDLGRPGWGWSVMRRGNVEASALYFYDQAGAPRWALGNNGGVDDASGYALSTYQGTCPSCNFVAATASPAGSMNRQFTSDKTAILTTNIVLPQPLSGDWSLQEVAVNKADQ